MDYFKNSAGLTDEHLKAIGLVAVNWSHIESTLSSIIWDIAKLRTMRGRAITTHLSEKTKGDMCLALANETFRGHPEEAELKEHITMILNQLHQKRNTIIHGLWGYSSNSGASDVLPIRARGKVSVGPRKSFSPDDILEIANDIEAAALKLELIRFKICQLLPTLSGWP